MIIKKKPSNDDSNKHLKSGSKSIENDALEDDVFPQSDFDNIDFDQRSERRQGSRRRGYRRIDDRNLVSRAQEEAASIKELAAQEGHKIGIESAKDDIKRLNDAIDDFFAYKDKAYEELSECILDISLEIAKKIINTEVSTNQSILLEIINNMLIDNSKGEDKIVIKVMPDDVEFVKDNIPKLLSNAQTEARIIVLADDNITSGGAIIETNNGIIDGTIETQVNIVQEAFKKI